MKNPYPKSATGHRKWEWLNIRKQKSTYFYTSDHQCRCGGYKVNRYYGRFYCAHCGLRLRDRARSTDRGKL